MNSRLTRILAVAGLAILLAAFATLFTGATPTHALLPATPSYYKPVGGTLITPHASPTLILVAIGTALLGAAIIILAYEKHLK